MAWTTPRTYTTGEIVTAAILNTDHRDNLLDLDRRTNAGVATVATDQTTTSTSSTDLATVGPAASATIGTTGICLVMLSARMFSETSGNQSVMEYVVSGATTRATDAGKSLYFRSDSGNQDLRASSLTVDTGLAAGLTTFTAKYRVSGGTSHFSDRAIAAIPLGR